MAPGACTSCSSMTTHKKKAPRRNRPVGDDEKDLWAQVTGDVKPLEKFATNRELTPADQHDGPAAAPPVEKTVAPPRRKRIVRVETPPTTRKALPTLSPGAGVGMDKQSSRRLRRGQADIDARMDLHGMTRDEAGRELKAFLARAAAAGHRTVLVITGKGLASDGGKGVLKAAVPGWLNESPNRERILGFSPAQPKDGGDGALYVRLKRKRSGP